MEFSELIKIRQSVRKYKEHPVEKEKIVKLIEAVRLAPSACNSQPWKLIIIDEPEIKNRVAQAMFSSVMPLNKFAPEAPVLAVMTIEKPKIITQIGGRIKQREFPLIDIGIAAEHFCLQATELGLGTCMIGWFDEKEVKKILQIPRKTRVGLAFTLGYAKDDYPLRNKARKDRDAMSCFNKYQ